MTDPAPFNPSLQATLPPPVETQLIPTATTTRIRVLCVDDSRDVTAALRMCIEGEADMESVGALHSADDLASEVDERRPDVVLLDLTMPGQAPLAALRELPQAGDGRRAVSVILFSGRDAEEVTEVAIEVGACGFLSKDAQVPVILAAIRDVARGHVRFGVWR